MLRLLLQDRDARLVARLFDPRDQAPVEAADQPLFQLRDLARRAVGDEDDLLVLLVQRVERVEELFLRPVAAGEEVDVVDDQHVDVAVAVAELVHLAGLDGVDELVDERVARQIQDARVRRCARAPSG